MASQSPFSSAFLRCYGQIHQESPFLPWPIWPPRSLALWPLQEDSPRARVVRSSASPTFILVSAIGAPAYWVSRKGRTSCGEASDSRATPGSGEKQFWGCPRQVWQLKPQTRLPWTEPRGEEQKPWQLSPSLATEGPDPLGSFSQPLGLWSTTSLKARAALLLPPAEPPPSFHYLTHTHIHTQTPRGRFTRPTLQGQILHEEANFRAPEIGQATKPRPVEAPPSLHYF